MFKVEIDQVDTIEPQVFKNVYYKKEKPLHILNATEHWPALNKWSIDYFMKNIGHKKAIINLFNYEDDKIERTLLPAMTISESINIMTQNRHPRKKYYILRDSIVNHYPELLPDLSLPSCFDQDTFYSRDLWFGDEGNITPIHFDAADNFIVPIFGAKTVYLYPKNETQKIYPHSIKTKGRFNFAESVSRRYVELNAFPLFDQMTYYEIDVYPGQMLYIPPGWWHEVHTHDNKSASVSYFFNKRGYPCFAWHILGYQSCRLHEINNDNVLQEMLYKTNFSNGLQLARLLSQKGHLTLSAILAIAILENLLVLEVQQPHEHILTILDQNSDNPICQELLVRKDWPIWQKIISFAHDENDERLAKHDIEQFIQDIEIFVSKYLEQSPMHVAPQYYIIKNLT